MARRASRRRLPPPELPPGGYLNWRNHSVHWSEIPRPCRYCGGLTNLRDSRRKPAHKVCAEDAVRRWVEEEAERYENEKLRDR